MRFKLITNSPYDYLDYEPTKAHLFLEEPTLEAFENYVDLMFNVDIKNDWSYFKLFKNLSPSDFNDLAETIHRGTFKNSSGSNQEKVPISIIPVIEHQLLEDHSSLYTVKSTSRPLDRMYIRLKLNTYFVSLMKLLQCSEEDIVDVLYRKGVLPSRQFQLVTSQKETMVSLKRFYSDMSLCDRLGEKLREVEQSGCLVKPAYGFPNSNLVQALSYMFSTHPLFMKHIDSLKVETTFVSGGKGYLSQVERPKKRKYAENPRDQSSLPKKLVGESDVSRVQIEGERQSTIKQTANDILQQAMIECLPEYLVESNEEFLTLSIDRKLFRDGFLLCIREEDSGEIIINRIADN
jgi:hypothetical protein